MITIAVPPALPACLTIATVFSIRRLRKHGVFVTGPDRITMAGQLDVCCFDKTGASGPLNATWWSGKTSCHTLLGFLVRPESNQITLRWLNW